MTVLWWRSQWKFRRFNHTASLSPTTHTQLIWNFPLYFTTNCTPYSPTRMSVCLSPVTQQHGAYLHFMKYEATRRICTPLWIGWQSSNGTPKKNRYTPFFFFFLQLIPIWTPGREGEGYVRVTCLALKCNIMTLVRTVMNLGCPIQSCIHFWLSHSHSLR